MNIKSGRFKSPLKGKNVILGVSGGIATYKSVLLLRLLQKEGADVKVVMTQSACQFVTELTFRAISKNKVYINLFDNNDAITHIKWAENADVVVIAPATANIVGKLAGGIADDALSTLMLAVKVPVIICPSMNTNMYENKIVQRNLDILEKDGFYVLEPEKGELACGISGAGRVPEPEFIVDRMKSILTKKNLAGKKILITAGPTREPIDPVRYISNHSSGKMGYSIAKMAEYRGADVTLISGPVTISPPINVSLINVETANEMADAVYCEMNSSDILIKVAAVADYKPKQVSKDKLKKNNKDGAIIELVQNPDILMEIATRKDKQFIVGFAAETKELEKNACKKLLKKKLDIIVGNIVGCSDSGFGTDTNVVTFFYENGAKEDFSLMDKELVADILLDRIIEKESIMQS